MKVPRLKLYQIIIEILCFALVIAGLVYTLIKYPSLPAEIPGHYNSAGEVTDYSGKQFIWVLEGINILMWVTFTVLIFIPSIIRNPNTTWKINPLAKEIAASETISILGETKLECIIMFDYMLIPIMSCEPMVTWPIWVIIGIMTVGITIRMIHMKKVTELKQPWER